MCLPIFGLSQARRTQPPQGDSNAAVKGQVSGETRFDAVDNLEALLEAKLNRACKCGLKIGGQFAQDNPGTELCMFCAAGYRGEGK